MTLRDWKNRFLGTPWVYDTLRPLVVGGLDLGVLARFCATQPGDRIFDLGCGTAQLVSHLRFERYLGVDLDPVALARAARIASPRQNLSRRGDTSCACLHPWASMALLTR